MNKKVKLFLVYCLLIAVFASLLAGCKKKEEEVSESSIEEASQESSQETSSMPESSSESSKEESSEESSEDSSEPEETVDLTKINPLTGEPSEEDISKKRPYIFMINNIEVATPPRGVSHADIIMELMEEGGITRMMAFFMHPEEANNIGSIRSARIYNVEVALAFDGILIHCGGSKEAMSAIPNYGLNTIDQYVGKANATTFYRDPTRTNGGIEHSLFAWGAEVIKNPDELGYKTEREEEDWYGLRFSEDAVEQCTEGDANYIFVTYDGGKQTNFQYDASRGGYTGYQYNKEYMDNGEIPITFENVIVMFAETWLQADGLHISMDLSSGTGYYCTEGKYVAINWYKDDMYSMFHFELEDGTPLVLGIGKTFICVNQCGNHAYNGYVTFE